MSVCLCVCPSHFLTPFNGLFAPTYRSPMSKLFRYSESLGNSSGEKSFTILDDFFSLFFPKDSEDLKSLDMGLRGVGAKRPLNGVRKCDGQTDKQTHRHTDISTYRKHRPRGPML